jgi:hypothetical protein
LYFHKDKDLKIVTDGLHASITIVSSTSFPVF